MLINLLTLRCSDLRTYFIHFWKYLYRTSISSVLYLYNVLQCRLQCCVAGSRPGFLAAVRAGFFSDLRGGREPTRAPVFALLRAESGRRAAAGERGGRRARSSASRCSSSPTRSGLGAPSSSHPLAPRRLVLSVPAVLVVLRDQCSRWRWTRAAVPCALSSRSSVHSGSRCGVRGEIARAAPAAGSYTPVCPFQRTACRPSQLSPRATPIALQATLLTLAFLPKSKTHVFYRLVLSVMLRYCIFNCDHIDQPSKHCKYSTKYTLTSTP